MIKVLKTGFYSTIQDLGRFGYQQYGVPYSGVMDMLSASFANSILGNALNSAVLEITMTGPALEFFSETVICISGANISPQLNNINIKHNKAIKVNAGDVLSFGKLNNGFRCYLAVLGGFKAENVMKSLSMYKNITSNVTISKNDELLIDIKVSNLKNSFVSIKANTKHFKTLEIDVLEGPEFGLLSKEQQDLLISKTFTISKENNRMAYQLNDLLPNDLKSIITSSVLPGTVQLTPSGKLIILMRDCQTTGGYPRVLQLKESAINVLSQKFTGNTISFRLV
jgi:biotin-dependent carboxylase-like uncharacterized protein